MAGKPREAGVGSAGGGAVGKGDWIMLRRVPEPDEASDSPDARPFYLQKWETGGRTEGEEIEPCTLHVSLEYV